MNIIFGKHDGCNKEFCWEVSDLQKDYISKGDMLYVDTSKGKQIAVATTNVICGKGAIDIAKDKGAYIPLKSVVSFANNQMKHYMYNYTKNEIIASIQNKMFTETNSDDVPF